MNFNHQIIIVGGGPAGLNAAKYAANAGADVALIDSGVRLGGQYWRHTGDEALDQSLHHNFDQGSLLIDAVKANQRIALYLESQIWSASVIDDSIVLRTSKDLFVTKKLIIATGAYDRSLPFPGWDIPGVMTAGAAQALLKGSGVIAGKKIVIGGTGPFLLPVAAGMSGHGGNIVGVIEAAGKAAWGKGFGALLKSPAKALEGAGYLNTLRKRKVEMRFRQAIVQAHANADGVLEAVTIANIDAGFKIKSSYRLSCDVAAISWGFTPDNSLAGALSVKQRVNYDGAVVIDVDSNQRATHPNPAIEIFAAGESTGIGGSDLALAEGAIAGLAAAHSRHKANQLRKLRSKAQKFADTLFKVYPIADGWKSWITPSTTICRCEEVKYQALTQARETLAAETPRDAKLFTRCGMGLCQGRVCARVVSDLFDGDADERIRSNYRPIIAPITLGELAEEGLL